MEYSKRGHRICVVLVHGLYGDMRGRLIEKLFNRLKGDYDVLRFNFSSTGNPKNMDTKKCVTELEAIVDFFGNRNIVLVGKSFGAYISSIVAAEERFDILGVIALGYYLHEEGKPSEVFDQSSARTIKVPFTIVKGTNDLYCNENVLKKEIPNCKLHVIGNADHSFKPIASGTSREDNEEKVISLVVKELNSLR